MSFTDATNTTCPLHHQKGATPRMARTLRATERMTIATVVSIRCLDSLTSTTIELTRLIGNRLPSTKFTTTCVSIVNVARSKVPVTVPQTRRHGDSDRRQCLRRLRRRQVNKFSRMFDSESHSLSVVLTTLSKHRNFALASSKFSTNFMFTSAHPPNQVRVWY